MSARAAEVIERLAAGIGPRLGGSDALREAADYVAGELAALGLEVERQDFRHIGWDYEREPVAEVVAPAAERLACAPVAYSGATDGPVEGTLRPDRRVVGSPRLLEFGRLAVTVDGVRRASLLVPPVDGPPYPLPLSDLTFEEPAVYVSRADGQRLETLAAEREVVVRVETFGRHVPGMRDQNVIGRIHGGEGRDTIVVGAHLDSAWRSPGAVDNASGIAALLEVAHRTVARGARHSFAFVAFGAEEWWSFGARHMVAEAERRGELDRYRAMLNCDPLSTGDTLELWVGPDRLAGRVDQIAQDLGLYERLPIRFREPAPGSDHFPFWLKGVPVCNPIFTPTPPDYHLPSDTPDRVDHARLDAIVELVDRVAASLDRVSALELRPGRAA